MTHDEKVEKCDVQLNLCKESKDTEYPFSECIMLIVITMSFIFMDHYYILIYIKYNLTLNFFIIL